MIERLFSHSVTLVLAIASGAAMLAPPPTQAFLERPVSSSARLSPDDHSVAMLVGARAHDDHVGTYRLGPDVAAWVQFDGEQLSIRVGVHPCYRQSGLARKRLCPIPAARLRVLPALALRQNARDEFVVEGLNARLRFTRDQRGKVHTLAVQQHADRSLLPGDQRTQLVLTRRSRAVRLALDPPELNLPPERLGEYAGVYRLSENFDLRISLQDRHLNVRGTDGPPFLLYRSAADQFFARLSAIDVVFERDSAGSVSGLLWFEGGVEHRAPRQGPDYVARMPPNIEAKACKDGGAASQAVDLERGRFVAAQPLHSARLGYAYPICVYLPPGYDGTARRYPVLYAVDGEFIEPLVAELERQRRAVVVVGIGGFERREVDLLLPGAAPFFEFIARELIPAIESRYRVDGAGRALFGHSLGGQFVVTAMLLDDPQSPRFAKLLSSDGSFWAAAQGTQALLEARRSRGARMPVSLFIAGAGQGNGAAVSAQVRRLQAQSFSGLRLEHLDGAAHNHNSIAAAAAAQALPQFFPHEPPPYAGVRVKLRWSASQIDFSPAGAGLYFAEADLAEGEGPLRVDTGVLWGGAPESAPLQPGASRALVRGGAALRLSPAQTGRQVFRLDATDPGAPLLTVAPKRSLFGAQPVYLRGSMNQWGLSQALHSAGDRAYAVEIELAPGTHEFKVGSRDFMTIDFGAAPGAQKVSPGVALVLARGGANLILNVTEPGRYRVTLGVADEHAPVLTVLPVMQR